MFPGREKEREREDVCLSIKIFLGQLRLVGFLSILINQKAYFTDKFTELQHTEIMQTFNNHQGNYIIYNIINHLIN